MRMIDAEEVIKAVDKHTFETKDGLCLDDDISIILEDVPTVEERKTGMWIDDCTCSVCHWIHENDDCCVLLTDYKYCPNCGAKMEGHT